MSASSGLLPSRHRCWPTRIRSWRRSRERGWGRSWRRLLRAILIRSFLLMAARKRTRTPSRSRASSPGATKLWRVIVRITGRRRARSALRAILADGLLSLGFLAWCACSIRITGSSAGGSQRKLAGHDRGNYPAGRLAHDCRVYFGDHLRNERCPDPAEWIGSWVREGFANCRDGDDGRLENVGFGRTGKSF